MRKHGATRRGRRARTRIGACLGALLAGACTPPVEAPDDHLVITFDVTGRARESGRVLSHRVDERHFCLRPARLRQRMGRTPAPGPDEPPNVIIGLVVSYGPDFPPESSRLSPEAAYFGPQHRFTLEVLPRPGQLEGTGPILLGRSFRIAVGTLADGGGFWERTIAEDEPPSAGRVTIAPDGTSGRVHATGLELQIPHNRMSEEWVVSVRGSWRCPRVDAAAAPPASSP
jgi:hypothetical protein